MSVLEVANMALKEKMKKAAAKFRSFKAVGPGYSFCSMFCTAPTSVLTLRRTERSFVLEQGAHPEHSRPEYTFSVRSLHCFLFFLSAILHIRGSSSWRYIAPFKSPMLNL